MTQTDLFRADTAPSGLFTPSRSVGLARIEAFTPAMGGRYAGRRNFDFGPDDRSNVSALSAHVRHRLVLESELAQAALTAHGISTAEKFLQEVCWRTYWKGWLAHRPSVWRDYAAELDLAIAALGKDGALRERYDRAVEGRTGIACFDAWAEELATHGWLHNHARMWFASIWIFTLDLPWVLGADFFFRNLIDGDPASNTLSWRWVGGRQTAGKTYLARASNIEKYTAGRFAPDAADLAPDAPEPEDGVDHPAPAAPPPGVRPDPGAPALLLIHDEDCHPESWGVDGLDIRGAATLSALDRRSPLSAGDAARTFTRGALADAAEGTRAAFSVDAAPCETLADVVEAARVCGAAQIVTQRPHEGPLGDLIDGGRPDMKSAGLAFAELRRDWDRAFYPHATKGFFKLKKAIPGVLAELGLR
ncbi:MAG: FAD-binding domain-containing protein [Oceanicaulis sp.]